MFEIAGGILLALAILIALPFLLAGIGAAIHGLVPAGVWLFKASILLLKVAALLTVFWLVAMGVILLIWRNPDVTRPEMVAVAFTVAGLAGLVCLWVYVRRKGY